MKKLLVLTTLFFATSAFALYYDNEPTSFRGIRFGTHISSCRDMIHYDGDANVIMYSRKGEKMSVGAAKLSEIHYVFYKGDFYSAQISFSGLGNAQKLTTILKEKYGEPNDSNKFSKDCTWFGDTTTIKFTYNRFSEKGTILYVYMSILRTQLEDEKQDARDTDYSSF